VRFLLRPAWLALITTVTLFVIACYAVLAPWQFGREADRDAQSLLSKLNREHAASNPGDSRLEGRISAYELAARMQLSAPEVMNISKEPPKLAACTLSTTR